jgi:hypothetical protein
LVIVVVVLGTEIVVSAKVVAVMKVAVQEIEVQSILLLYPLFALF